jgi:hypothetical protein
MYDSLSKTGPLRRSPVLSSSAYASGLVATYAKLAKLPPPWGREFFSVAVDGAGDV